MGVHYLMRNHERYNARLPFRITFSDKDDMEGDCFIEDYKEMGNGEIKYIGIDGSVFIHSYIISEADEVDIELSAKKIAHKILEYVKSITYYFNFFNGNNEENAIILHLVFDGKPPVAKNRKLRGKPDLYTIMSDQDKKELHDRIVSIVEEAKDNKRLILLSNKDESDDIRGEGELVLYSLCQKIRDKYRDNANIRTVIVSSDSDVVALMLLKRDKNMIVISPTTNQIYMTSYNLITKGLKLQDDQIAKYVILHFIFFGSDYNLGLMTNPNDSKQYVIHQAVKEGWANNVDDVGIKCVRRKNKKQKITKSDHYLEKLKKLLIEEAICSILYYTSFGNKHYLKKHSPLLFRKDAIKKFIPLISFSSH